MEHLKIPAHGISIHALLAESDISVFWTALSRPLFLSTLSLRRATHYDNYNLHCVEISIHALLAESDGASSKYMSYGWDFYPRSPCGERRSAADLPRPVQDFYPRSPCGERQVLRYGVLTASLISIHALLAESDAGQKAADAYALISIHALLAESDVLIDVKNAADRKFLSTLSLRRATPGRRSAHPHLPISIHALLAESDDNGYDGLSQVTVFLSTLSLRRATLRPLYLAHVRQHFYPRSPCGERPVFS